MTPSQYLKSFPSLERQHISTEPSELPMILASFIYLSHILADYFFELILIPFNSNIVIVPEASIEVNTLES